MQTIPPVVFCVGLFQKHGPQFAAHFIARKYGRPAVLEARYQRVNNHFNPFRVLDMNNMQVRSNIHKVFVLCVNRHIDHTHSWSSVCRATKYLEKSNDHSASLIEVLGSYEKLFDDVGWMYAHGGHRSEEVAIAQLSLHDITCKQIIRRRLL